MLDVLFKYSGTDIGNYSFELKVMLCPRKTREKKQENQTFSVVYLILLQLYLSNSAISKYSKKINWLHLDYVEDLKELLITLTKPEMAETYSRYSTKAPEPSSAQFNDCINKQSSVKAYTEMR